MPLSTSRSVPSTDDDEESKPTTSLSSTTEIFLLFWNKVGHNTSAACYLSVNKTKRKTRNLYRKKSCDFLLPWKKCNHHINFMISFRHSVCFALDSFVYLFCLFISWARYTTLLHSMWLMAMWKMCSCIPNTPTTYASCNAIHSTVSPISKRFFKPVTQKLTNFQTIFSSSRCPSTLLMSKFKCFDYNFPTWFDLLVFVSKTSCAFFSLISLLFFIPSQISSNIK